MSAVFRCGLAASNVLQRTSTPRNPANPAGPAKYGLCTAYAHNSDQAKQHGQAFKNLADAASAANQSVADYCKDATPGGR